MAKTNLHELTIAEASAGLSTGEFSAAELAEAVIDRIAAVDNNVKAYLALKKSTATAPGSVLCTQHRSQLTQHWMRSPALY